MSCVEKNYQAALYGAVYKVPLSENPAYQLLMRCGDVSPSHALEVVGLGCVNIVTAWRCINKLNFLELWIWHLWELCADASPGFIFLDFEMYICYLRKLC
jgi:hypothetical protein